jgi:gas vesicle protein GvpO
MKSRDGAKSARSKGADQESHNLVGDLLRRATSPEVLAGVAGAAAAARFTRHAFDQSEDDEPEASVESEEEVDEAEVDETDDSPQDEAEPETGDETEPEPEDESERETEDESEPETEDEAEPENEDESEQSEPHAEEHEAPADRSAAGNGSLRTDDDRMQLLARAREYAEDLTGHAVESFSSLACEEHGWRVGMEVVEVSRVPSTTDVLASYEVVLTEEGELVDFRRTGRYYRNATDGDSS